MSKKVLKWVGGATGAALLLFGAGAAFQTIRNGFSDDVEATDKAPPMTGAITNGYYRTARNDTPLYEGGSVPYISATFKNRVCVEVVNNIQGYEYASVRYASPTPSGYKTGYMKKEDLVADPACTSLAQQFAQLAQSSVPAMPEYKSAYTLRYNSYLFAKPDAAETDAPLATVPIGTCVRPDFQTTAQQMQRVTAMIDGKVMTGWGRMDLDYARPCSPGF